MNNTKKRKFELIQTDSLIGGSLLRIAEKPRRRDERNENAGIASWDQFS